jgi:hypothetical protein
VRPPSEMGQTWHRIPGCPHCHMSGWHQHWSDCPIVARHQAVLRHTEPLLQELGMLVVFPLYCLGRITERVQPPPLVS